MTTGSGATFVFEVGYETTTQILVNGTMSATGTTFNLGGNNASLTQIQVNSGGELTATNSTFNLNQLVLESGSILSSTDLTNDTFNLPLYLPALDIPLVANNLSFHAIEIFAGTLSTGQSLSLNQIGTASTANLVYVFTGAFTVQAGATLNVSPNVGVEINPNVTITDNGALTTGSGATFVFEVAYQTTTQIVVNGTMSATGTTFNLGGNNASLTQIQVNSGGELTAAGSTFALNQMKLNAGSTDTLQFMAFATQLTINSGASISVHSDDFSSTSASVVAAGASTATIDLTNNFWGTLNTTQIAAKITDHSKNSNLPTVLYQPFLTENATGTYAANASATYSASAQTVNLTATVIAAGKTVNEGTETFTILSGGTTVGSSVTVNVVNGAATASYGLPPGTAGGTDTIQAVYNGTSNFLGSSDSSHSLTISSAATNTAATSATATYSTASQSVSLTPASPVRLARSTRGA